MTSPFAPRFRISAFLTFTALVCAILALFRWSGVDLTAVGGPASVLYPLGVAVVCALSVMRPRGKARWCPTCGRQRPPVWGNGPDRPCRACRIRELPPQRRRRAEYRALFVVVVLFLMLSFMLLWPFSSSVQGRIGWWVYPVLATALFFVVFAVFFVVLVLRRVVGMWRMVNPRYALHVARECARFDGMQQAFGAVTVHTFGPADPTPMLKAEMDSCRTRFEALVGEPVEGEPPLRFFVFERRADFEAFFLRASLVPGNLDGVYAPWRVRTTSLTTDFPAYRVPDTRRLTRVLGGYYFLDAYRKRRSPLWLQAGVAQLLACGGDQEELSRLNRRVFAAVGRGTVYNAADLFHASPGLMVKLVRIWKDHDSFVRYTEFVAQAWSVAEYLGGAEAPEERRESFRGYLKGVDRSDPKEEAVRRHFGCGYDALLEGWRQWVVSRGIGIHHPPDPESRSALLEGVIPVVEDRKAPLIDRIQAVRELGRVGSAIAAKTLMGQLHAEDPVPQEEVVWTLEAISGMALGHDEVRWRDWLKSLPADAIDVFSPGLTG